jgi:type II secretory pathway pseudopilin PulG
VLTQFTALLGLTALLASLGGRQLARERVVVSEQLALATLRQIAQAAELYRTINQRYPPDLAALGPPNADPPYLQPDLVGDGRTVTRQGYIFTYTPRSPFAYTLKANPARHGVTGRRRFFATEALGAVHVTGEDRDATSADPLVR